MVAQCCRIKLEDEAAGALAETAVVCALLDQESCAAAPPMKPDP